MVIVELVCDLDNASCLGKAILFKTNIKNVSSGSLFDD